MYGERVVEMRCIQIGIFYLCYSSITMNKLLSFRMFWFLLLWVWFFGFVWAQGNDYIFGPDNVPTLQDLYRVDIMIEQLPLLVARDANILRKADGYYHLVAADEGVYEIDSRMISEFLAQSSTFEEFYQKVRIHIIQFLMDGGYLDFTTQPYERGELSIRAQSWDFSVVKDIEKEDILDAFLDDQLQSFRDDFPSFKKFTEYLYFKNIQLTPEQSQKFWTLFMFKNEQDLRDLWYELISWKTRINTDPDYRRHNIMTAFNNIGNVRLIMPNQTFSIARELHYSPNASDGKKAFVDGYATFGNGARMVYGGWLCGVATAFYQGTLTNLWLSLVEYQAHSIYYRNLYEAEVNGEYISNPWLDATIYSPNIDFQIKNIRDYPIITVLNFDWLSGQQEQVFTLSQAQDRGSFEYIGIYKKGSSTCFTRKINWSNRTNCYTAIKNF